MHYRLILHSFGNLLSLLALTMIWPLTWALKDKAPDVRAFFFAITITATVGYLLRLIRPDGKFGRREGFVIVGLGWILVVAFGALPLYLSGTTPSYTDAFFEIMSGFTTTGATILTNVEGATRGILFWRSLTHWLGGMGIVVLSLAIFSIFGEGASLYQAEVPGLVPERILPRLKETAVVLWAIYTVISILQTIALKLAGMSFFDSLIHTFGSMGTGGFSSRNISVEAYHSLPIELIITFFMIIAGMNFSLYYRVIQKRSLGPLLGDAEAKGFLGILAGAAICIAVSLFFQMKLPLGEAMRHALFQAVSICTTTGFSSTDFALWPSFAQGILLLLMFIGGCTGSTGGSIKVARIILLFKYMWRQILRIARPRLMIQTKLGDISVADGVIHETLVFFFIYIMLFAVGSLVVMATGPDMITALSAAAATLGNIGPGLAKVGPLGNYSFLHPVAKWTLSFLMLAGRLELLTIMVMISPSFWKK
jgi:trk system potassium uptake protein TrkH